MVYTTYLIMVIWRMVYYCFTHIYWKTMGNSSVQFDYRRAMRCNETQWDCHGLLNELRGNSGRGATAILYVRRD